MRIAALHTEKENVINIVNTTRAIQGWIDGRMEAGWTDEQIEMVLPHATAFIIGEITEEDLYKMVEKHSAQG